MQEADAWSSLKGDGEVTSLPEEKPGHTRLLFYSGYSRVENTRRNTLQTPEDISVNEKNLITRHDSVNGEPITTDESPQVSRSIRRALIYGIYRRPQQRRQGASFTQASRICAVMTLSTNRARARLCILLIKYCHYHFARDYFARAPMRRLLPSRERPSARERDRRCSQASAHSLSRTHF